MKYLFINILLIPMFSNAGVGKTGLMLCQVHSFDEKFVQLNCDPDSKDILKMPRAWMSPDEKKIKADQIVHVRVTKEQLNTLMSLNKNLMRKPASTVKSEKGS